MLTRSSHGPRTSGYSRTSAKKRKKRCDQIQFTRSSNSGGTYSTERREEEEENSIFSYVSAGMGVKTKPLSLWKDAELCEKGGRKEGVVIYLKKIARAE